MIYAWSFFQTEKFTVMVMFFRDYSILLKFKDSPYKSSQTAFLWGSITSAHTEKSLSIELSSKSSWKYTSMCRQGLRSRMSGKCSSREWLHCDYMEPYTPTNPILHYWIWNSRKRIDPPWSRMKSCTVDYSISAVKLQREVRIANNHHSVPIKCLAKFQVCPFHFRVYSTFDHRAPLVQRLPNE